MLLIKTLLSHFASSFVSFRTLPFAFGLESLKDSSKSGVDGETKERMKKKKKKSVEIGSRKFQSWNAESSEKQNLE